MSGHFHSLPHTRRNVSTRRSSRPMSKIGLLDDSADPSVEKTKNNPPKNRTYETLDASVLLRRKDSSSSWKQQDIFREGEDNQHSPGFENEGFAIEKLGGDMDTISGSRKPVVGVLYRTASSERIVIENYCKNTHNTSQNCKKISDSSSLVDVISLENRSQLNSHANDKLGPKGSIFIDRVCTPRPRVKLFRHRPCNIQLQTIDQLNADVYCHRAMRIHWTKRREQLRSKLDNIVVNTDFITDSDSSDESISDDNNERPCRTSLVNYCNEDSLSQKTVSAKQEKTQAGSPANTRTSASKDMVRVGCVTRPLSGNYTNSIDVNNRHSDFVSNLNTTYVSVHQSVSDDKNRKLPSVHSNVGCKIGNNVSALRATSLTTSSAKSVPIVSALTKVSSVRICPTPISTPTPSVTGTPSENGSTRLAPPPQRVSLIKLNLPDCMTRSAIPRPDSSKSNFSTNEVSNVKVSSVENVSRSLTIVTNSTDIISSETRPINSNSVSSITNEPSGSKNHDKKMRNDSCSASPDLLNESNQISNLAANDQQTPNSNTPVCSSPVLASTSNVVSTASPTDSSEARDATSRREEKVRRRERRERRRQQRRAVAAQQQYLSGGLLLPAPPPRHSQTDISTDPSGTAIAGSQNQGNPSNSRLPDLLNSHIPPPYSTLPSGARTHGAGVLPPPGHPPISQGGPGGVAGVPGPPMAIHLPSGAPLPPGYLPPAPGSPMRPPPGCPWPFFGTRR